jgi:hypothetical protein
MIGALRAAGFPGVEEEEEGGVIHARLDAKGPAFTAQPAGDGWTLALTRPMRASPAQIAGWNAAHPGTPLDLWQGETRLTQHLTAPTPAALAGWAAAAELFVATAQRWRRDQRAPGEGM